jgi:RimJ/RimL family protein N-acetyltransferase
MAPLTDPGAMLVSTHELADGSRTRLRLTRPTDAARVSAFLEGAPDSIVRHFTFYDPRERLMLAATMLVDGSERIVGLAAVAFLTPSLAEIGVVVDDDAQGQGLGKLLSEAVASLALQRGATRLRAEMLDENEPMMRLLERLGRTVHSVEDGRAVAYTRLSRAPRRRRAA